MAEIVIVVKFEVKPARRADFLQLMQAHAVRSRAEAGCLQFDVLTAADQDAAVVLVERYADEAALDVHRANSERAQVRQTYQDWIADRTFIKATRV